MAKTITRAISQIDVRPSLPLGDGPGIIISWTDSAGGPHQVEIFDAPLAGEIRTDLTATDVMGHHHRQAYLVGFIRHEMLRRLLDARRADAAEVRQVPILFAGQDTR